MNKIIDEGDLKKLKSILESLGFGCDITHEDMTKPVDDQTFEVSLDAYMGSKQVCFGFMRLDGDKLSFDYFECFD
jgi:hypothetical protein